MRVRVRVSHWGAATAARADGHSNGQDGQEGDHFLHAPSSTPTHHQFSHPSVENPHGGRTSRTPTKGHLWALLCIFCYAYLLQRTVATNRPPLRANDQRWDRDIKHSTTRVVMIFQLRFDCESSRQIHLSQFPISPTLHHTVSA